MKRRARGNIHRHDGAHLQGKIALLAGTICEPHLCQSIPIPVKQLHRYEIHCRTSFSLACKTETLHQRTPNNMFSSDNRLSFAAVETGGKSPTTKDCCYGLQSCAESPVFSLQRAEHTKTRVVFLIWMQVTGGQVLAASGGSTRTCT